MCFWLFRERASKLRAEVSQQPYTCKSAAGVPFEESVQIPYTTTGLPFRFRTFPGKICSSRISPRFDRGQPALLNLPFIAFQHVP